MEQTLVIFKPDAVMRGIVGEILSRFEKVGLKIIGVKMLQPDQSQYEHHYEAIGTLKTRKGDEIFSSTLSSMLDGPVVLIVLEGVNSIETVRKMVGATEPKQALPGTIRGDFSHVTYAQVAKTGKAVANIIHASADMKEAKAEISHWFSEAELFDYEAVHEKFTQPRP